MSNLEDAELCPISDVGNFESFILPKTPGIATPLFCREPVMITCSRREDSDKVCTGRKAERIHRTNHETDVSAMLMRPRIQPRQERHEMPETESADVHKCGEVS